MSAVLGLFALAIVVALVGLAIAAVKWLLVIAVVLFLLGVLRALMTSQDRTDGRGGPHGRESLD
jgi:hypothetical protein